MRAVYWLGRASLVVCAVVPMALAAPDAPTEPELGRYWERQPIGGFVAGHVAAGGLNRVMLNGGYGRPHWLWGGAQLEAMTTTEFAAFYGGVQLELLLINLALGPRYTLSYAKHFLPQASHYGSGALADPTLPIAHQLSFDAALWGYVPAGPTLGYWEVDVSWYATKARDLAVFDEYSRLVVTGQWVGLARLLWVVQWWGKRLSLGPMVEVAGTPERAMMLRLGGGFQWVITGHLTAKLVLSVPVTGPDSLGWFTQSFAVARLTWSWSSSDQQPGFR